MNRTKIEFFLSIIPAFLLGIITVLYATQSRDMESILITLALLVGSEFFFVRAVFHANDWSKHLPEPTFPDLDAPVPEVNGNMPPVYATAH